MVFSEPCYNKLRCWMTFFPVTHIVKLTLNYLHIQSPPSLLLFLLLPYPRECVHYRNPGSVSVFVLLMRKKKKKKIPPPGVHIYLRERTRSPGLWKLAGGVLFPR